VVFTLPEQIAAIAFYNKEVVYHILFRTVAETLLSIARDPQHLGADWQGIPSKRLPKY
jgi:hypothetical protein